MKTIIEEHYQSKVDFAREADRKKFISLIQTTFKISKARSRKKIGMRLQIDTLNDNNEKETIEIDTDDFFFLISGEMINDFIQNIFIPAQVKKLQYEKKFS